MTSTTQQENQPNPEPMPGEGYSDLIFTVIGLFLVLLLVWFTIRGKLRDWFMK